MLLDVEGASAYFSLDEKPSLLAFYPLNSAGKWGDSKRPSALRDWRIHGVLND